jgi:uncharacterized protein (TIRG00374 family)
VRRWPIASWLWVVVVIAVAWTAYRHRRSVTLAIGLIGRADVSWLAIAAVMIGGVYLCRAGVYAVPLRLLGYDAPRSFLWSAAIAATSLHQLLPTAGASGYAFLTYALHQRGVSAGQASLVALIDTLTYSMSLAALVIASLAYLVVGGVLPLQRTVTVFAPGAVIVALAAWIYRRQRERRTFVPLVLRGKTRLASLLGRRWPDAPVEEFFDNYYVGKRLIGRRPRAFYDMMGLQFLAIACDTTALYVSFLAIGVTPNLLAVLIGFTLAMSGAAVIGAPGGGGSFETIMSAFWATHGLGAAQGLAAAVLYRVAAFWLPVGVTGIILLRLRHRRRQITRRSRQ